MIEKPLPLEALYNLNSRSQLQMALKWLNASWRTTTSQSSTSYRSAEPSSPPCHSSITAAIPMLSDLDIRCCLVKSQVFYLPKHTCKCCKNVKKCFQSYQVVRIIRPVRRGEEVSIDYGFDFYANPLEARQKRANSQYHFACRCLACLNNWPTYNDLVLHLNKDLMLCYE